MRQYVRPQSIVAVMRTGTILDMSVTSEEFNNGEALGKRLDSVGLEIVYDEDVWKDFWLEDKDERSEEV